MSTHIPETQHAVVAYAPGDYRFEQVEIPAISDDEMLSCWGKYTENYMNEL